MHRVLHIQHKDLRNLPLFLLYYIFPFVSFAFQIMGNGYVNYEWVWMLLLLFACTLGLKHPFKQKELLYLLLFELLIISKYFIPVFWTPHITYRPLVMDMKWVIYLLFAFFWTRLFGSPDKSMFYKSSLFFCKVYISLSILHFILTKQLRYCLLSEANYDCFLFLIGFCFIPVVQHQRRDYFLFFLATILSGSQTGLASFFALCLILAWKRNKPLIIMLLPIAIAIIYVLFRIRRGDADLAAIDRFIFFAQVFSFFDQNDLSTFLFGTFPGEPMNISPLASFQFYISLFEKMNEISGCYAFYFHSTYLRFAITWGVPFIIFLFIGCIYKFIKTKYLPFKLLLCLILLQSVSLSSFTLTTVSIVLFLAIFYIVHIERTTRHVRIQKRLQS